MRRPGFFYITAALVYFVAVQCSLAVSDRILLPRFCGYSAGNGEHLQWVQESGRGIIYLVSADGSRHQVDELAGSAKFWYGFISIGSGFLLAAVVLIPTFVLWPRVRGDAAGS